MRERRTNLYLVNLAKILNIFLLLFTLIGISFGQINIGNSSLIVSADTVDDYYAKLDTSKVGKDFRSELAELITITHTKETTYKGLAQVFKVADADPDKPGNIIWFYSGTSTSFSGFGSGNGSTNREHVWPKDGGRAFDANSRAGSDGHHLRPTEAQLNSTRGSLSFGIVPQTTANIVKQNGSTNYENLCYKANGLFYPGEGYRGATARILMYVQTRWGDTFNLKFVDSAGSCKTIGKISDLLRWHLEEPVTEAEIARNNAVYNIQGNRNPFIDHPEYATKIYCHDGESYNSALQKVSKEVGDYDNPNPSVKLTELSINGTANKLEYTAGEKFDPAGLSVVGKYSDGSVKTLPNSYFKWLDGTNYSQTLQEGTTTVKCVYGTLEATYSGITVKENTNIPIGPTTGSWKLVTDVGSLKNGDKIVIVSQSEGKIAGELSGTYLKSVDVTFSDTDKKVISTIPNEALILTLNKVGNNWELVTESGKKLGATDVKKLSLGSGDTNWGISISSDATATIQSSTNKYGRFLYNVTAPRFTTYSSTTSKSMLLPQIYNNSEGGQDTPHVCSFDKMVVSDAYKASEATCTKKGTYYYSCACGKKGTETFEGGDLLPHSQNKVVSDKFKASNATCSKRATYYYSCECGYISSNTFESGELLPHNLVIDEAREATCTRTGLTRGEHCSVCNTVTVKQIVLDRLPHDYVWIIDKVATIDTTGLKHEECSNCKIKRNENTIIDKLTHVHEMNFFEGVNATCDADGVKAYYLCTICDKKYFDINGNIEASDLTIKALGHKWKDATYEFDFGSGKCYGVSVCEHDSSHFKKAEADLVKTVIQKETCQDMGIELYKAIFTEEAFTSQESYQYYPALEHVYVIDKGYPSTCSKAGLSEGAHCEVCKKVLVAQEELPLLEHDYGNWVYTKLPTSSSNGEIRRVCSLCQHADLKEVVFASTIKKVEKDGFIISTDQLGVLEKDVELSINDVSDKYKGKEISDFVSNVSIKNGKIIKIYDFAISTNGNKIQPNGTVTVLIQIDFDLKKNADYMIAYINGDQMIIHDAQITSDGNIMFETNHFSDYAIIEVEKKANNPFVYIGTTLLVVVTLTSVTLVIVKNKKKKNIIK